MSHYNMAFSGTDTGTEASADHTGHRESTGSRRNMYEERGQFDAPQHGQGALPYETDAKTFPVVMSDSKNGTPLTGVFVLSPSDLKKNPKEYLDDYEPHENRNLEHPTSSAETMLHLLKGSLGTGILAMPLAFYHAGWAIGIVFTTLIGLICTYCIHILIQSEYELCKRKRVPSLNYQDTAITALGEGPAFFRAISPYAGHIVNTFLLIYQLGTCCVYIVFVATNIKAVVDQYAEPMDLRIYMVILLLPLILINWVRNLKHLAPFSTFANVLLLIGFGITFYYVFEAGVSFDGKEPVGLLRNMPLFFGMVLFALESIGVVLPLENNMEKPKSFVKPLGVLNWSMLIIITLYVCIGFFGYLKFGDKTAGSITLNLPADQGLAQSVKIMISISIFITHALQCYVAIDITWNGILGPRLVNNNHKLFYEYVVRTCLVLITFLLAVAIPNLELFISLFGALCLSALGIAIPAIVQTTTFWDSHKDPLTFYIMCSKNAALFLFALLGLIVGTYTSISDIIATFS